MSASTELAAQLADPAGLGRLLTRIENDPAARREVLSTLAKAPRAHRVGITGAPGVGKSTLLARLVPLLHQARTALVAVDPSSPRSGGAVLADRFRWNELAASGVFMRSLASRVSLGGTSLAARATVRVLEAAGYDPVVIETVGVGQTGAEICALADTVVFLLSPESGDSLQLLKAGLIEAGDIFVVNKGDRPGAEALLSDLRSALELEGDRDGWQPPVLQVSALNGDGSEDLARAIGEHRQYLKATEASGEARSRRIAQELLMAARAAAEDQLSATLAASPDLLASVVSGALDIDSAAAELLRRAGSAP
jgi:LAO/AO transport system kinase